MNNKPNRKTKGSKREVRVTGTPQRFEIRKNADGSQTIAGYAVRFNSLSLDLGGFKEKIAPGAFTQSLKDNPDVQILYAHDDSKILGRVSSGTATVTQDDKGVRFTCELPDTSTARDLVSLMKRQDVSQMSFGFSVAPNGDDWQQVGSEVIRTVNQAILYELSVVGSPAYEATSVSLRSCPAALRSKLKRLKRNDEGCDCDCPECMDDDCDNCSNPDCDDPNCSGSDGDGDGGDEECSCPCPECVRGACEACTNSACHYDNCLLCPINERAVHMDMILRRFRT
jgi:HK97 family phage prohead protease